jgi:nucleotide-binding universal stress UspA family protein
MKSAIFKKVMIATDGSELVKQAVKSAVEIAKLSEAKLYAVHVITLGSHSIIHSLDEKWQKKMKKQLTIEGEKATAYVENVGKVANIEVKSVIIEGSPANEIINFAEKNDIDLIVMGTHEKTEIQRFMVGSVAENVIRHSIKPVLIVKGESADLLLNALLKSPGSRTLWASNGKMIALLQPVLFVALGMIYFSEGNFNGFLWAKISYFNEEIWDGKMVCATLLFDKYETEAIHLVGYVFQYFNTISVIPYRAENIDAAAFHWWSGTLSMPAIFHCTFSTKLTGTCAQHKSFIVPSKEGIPPKTLVSRYVGEFGGQQRLLSYPSHPYLHFQQIHAAVTILPVFKILESLAPSLTAISMNLLYSFILLTPEN